MTKNKIIILLESKNREKNLLENKHKIHIFIKNYKHILIYY